MNEQRNSNVKDWPMVPIFRRRKRPRQAFYAEPSDTMDRQQEKENIPDAVGTNSRQNDFLNTSLDIVGMDDLMDPFPDDTSKRMQPYEKTPQRSYKSQQIMKTESTPKNHTRNVKEEENNRRSYAPALMKMPTKKENYWEKQTFLGNRTEPATPSIPTSSMPSKPPKSPSSRRGPIVPRMLTVTSKDIKEIMAHRDMMPALYEIYGYLDSTVTSLATNNAKRFTIRDGSGMTRCIFWEIDRTFPQTRRGASIRCVGRISNDLLQCLSIRPTNQEEISSSKSLLAKSQMVIQQYIVNKNEY